MIHEAKQQVFGCPVLIKSLEKEYGVSTREVKIEFRKSQDVPQFLKLKEEQEKKSQKTKMIFK